MDLLVLLGVGLLTGTTTVLFGFGGGFVTVPVVVWADSALGGDATRVAVATSVVVMVVNAGFATAVTPRRTLAALRGGGPLLLLLAAGGAAGAFATRLAPAALTHWAFVAYTAVTLADVLLRPGFLRPRGQAGSVPSRPLPALVGAPVGAVAAFLGVGGSVMTVPAMRRAGHPMRVAAALANPLTLALSLPAATLHLATAPAPALPNSALAGLVGLVDLRAATALLLGALPVIALLRRHPPRIPDRVHAWAYAGLLGVVVAAMALSGP
ncbi:TSUP family transporter [Streptomyces koyangensis]